MSLDFIRREYKFLPPGKTATPDRFLYNIFPLLINTNYRCEALGRIQDEIIPQRLAVPLGDEEGLKVKTSLSPFDQILNYPNSTYRFVYLCKIHKLQFKQTTASMNPITPHST